MKSSRMNRMMFVALLVVGFFIMGMPASGLAVNSSFDPSKMSDMSGFDPNTVVQPTGDTFKLGYMQILSGPAAANGELFWPVVNWVAYDLNKRGGILVDGKRKMIQIIKGDTQGKPAATKQEAERLCLEEKVNVLWGTSGSHLAKIISDVSNKYKVPFVNCLSLSDELMDAKNFKRYTFQTVSDTTQWNMAMAYFFKNRPQDKRFSILCQDYLYGHSMANAFKKALAEYRPDAKIVSEDYHGLWLKDFAPFLTKVMAAKPDILYTGDWMPDGDNLLKQARNMGLNVPIANIYITNPEAWKAVGVEGSKNLLICYQFMSGDTPQTPAQKMIMKAWHKQWLKWKEPYNKLIYAWPDFVIGQTLSDTYWLFDVIQRAGTTNPEKIISTWEGDQYGSIQGVRTMRAQDHQALFDMYVGVTTYPTKQVYPGALYSKGYAGVHKVTVIPEKYCTPPIPEGLKNRLMK
jgi:branched-chain amino acid transport system substrate-binding protein